LKGIRIDEGSKKQTGPYPNECFLTGSVQTGKRATGKTKNGSEGVEWLIFETQFKLGRNW
jgi:hypothetical protein